MISVIIEVFGILGTIFSVVFNVLDALTFIYDIGWCFARCAAFIYSLFTQRW